MLRLLLLVSLLAPVGAAAQAIEEVQRPEVKVGDRWVLRTNSTQASWPRKTIRENRVSFVDDKTIITVSTLIDIEGADSPAAKLRNKDAESETIWTADWNMLANPSGAIYKDHSAEFSFPLRPGKVYRADNEFSRPRERNATWRHQRTAKVVGWEEVTVPAGKFRALRIDIESQWHRLDIEARGTSRSAYWYVPAVKRWVKSSYEDSSGKSTTELISFEVR